MDGFCLIVELRPEINAEDFACAVSKQDAFDFFNVETNYFLENSIDNSSYLKGNFIYRCRNKHHRSVVERLSLIILLIDFNFYFFGTGQNLQGPCLIQWTCHYRYLVLANQAN